MHKLRPAVIETRIPKRTAILNCHHAPDTRVKTARVCQYDTNIFLSITFHFLLPLRTMLPRIISALVLIAVIAATHTSPVEDKTFQPSERQVKK